MRTGIPNGLTQLLGRLGLGGKPEIKATENALTARATDRSAGLLKGAALANGAVLAGLGHNPEDKHAGTRNLAERENINRFVQMPKKGEQEDTPASSNPAKDESHLRDGDKLETKELREELRREERVDDARGARVQEEKLEKEARTLADAKEHERQREEERDEDDRPGGAWLEEEFDPEEEEIPRRRGQLREDDALGSAVRCHGQLSEGTRCLRKPVPGTPYCREHAAAFPSGSST